MDQMKIYRVEQKNEEPVEVQIIRSSRRSVGLQVKADGDGLCQSSDAGDGLCCAGIY